jgi:uncharacterized RDD family membrane protein YckC
MSLPVVDGTDPTKSIIRRLVAWVLDTLLAALVVVAGFWLLPVTFVEHAAAPGVSYFEPEGSTLAIVVFALLPLAVWVGNEVVLQGRRGYTVGKFLLSLRTVRFDGRPPGMWRAFVRSLVLSVGLGLIGCFWGLFALLLVTFTKGHRRLGDLLAATFVIDSFYEGRLISLTSTGAVSGPPSVYASEVSEAVTRPGGDRALVEARLRPNDPVFDKSRGTYVVWNAKQDRLLTFDKETKTWEPAD